MSKDSIVLISPESIALRLKLEFGEDWEAVLLSDFNLDSIPTHIIGARAFLVFYGKKKFVAKIGLHADLAQEKATLENIRKLTLEHFTSIPACGVNFPIAEDIVDLEELGLAALIMSFHGTHTLEAYRIQFDAQSIENGLCKVLDVMTILGIAWPSIVARNIILDAWPNREALLSPIDWELGFYDVQSAKSSYHFYTRCIQLLEESAAFTNNLLPYWSDDWPSPIELAISTSHDPLYMSIELEDLRDPRMDILKNFLELPKSINDAQYFRLLQVFCSLCERRAQLHSVLYAGDQISEWAEAELRVKCTLLSWFLQNNGEEAVCEKLHMHMARVAHQVHQYWRGGYDKELTRSAITTIILHFQNDLEKLAISKVGTSDWSTLINERCRQFVIDGAGVRASRFRILHRL